MFSPVVALSDWWRKVRKIDVGRYVEGEVKKKLDTHERAHTEKWSERRMEERERGAKKKVPYV